MQSQIDQLVSNHAVQLAKANADALGRYVAMEKNKQEAIDEANRLARRNADAAAGVRVERDRLRDQIAAANSRMSTASVAAIRNYSATLSFVLGECAAEVEGVAKAADGHALDSRTLIGAWPK